MKYIFTLTVIFLLSITTWSQSSLSVLTYPNKSEKSSVTGYVIKAGNGFGIAGITGHKVFLQKLDAQKNIIWQRTWYDADNFFGEIKFAYCKNGGFVIASETTMNGTMVFKTDASGNILWNKVYKNTNTTFFLAPANTITELSDGSLILVNIINQNNKTYAGLLKVGGNNGNVLNWIVLANNYQTEILSISPAKDSGFILAGRYSTSEAYFTVIKFDKNESIEWNTYYNTSNPTASYKREATAIKQTSDGGYILTGYGPSQENISSDLYILKLNATGKTQWTVKTGTVGDDIGEDVIETNDSGYAITSHSGNSVAVAIKLNKAGNYTWSKILTPDDTRLTPVSIIPDNQGYLISGVYQGHLLGNNAVVYGIFSADIASDGSYCANSSAFRGFNRVSTTSSDYVLNRYDYTSSIAASNGSLSDSTNDLVTVSICSAAGSNNKPVTSLASAQTNKPVIYPNPVADILYVSFNQKQFTPTIQLNITDMNGKTVAAKAININGTYSINVSMLKAGLYILKISDGAIEEKLKFVKQGN